MARTLQTYAVYRPDAQAAEAADRALDLLADALADLLIDEARAEVAAEIGVDEASIDREQGRQVVLVLVRIRCPLPKFLWEVVLQVQVL